MSSIKSFLLLVLLVGFGNAATGQPEHLGFGGKETLSHLKGVEVKLRTSHLDASDKVRKIGRKLRQNVVVPRLEDAGIKVYSFSEANRTDSNPVLEIEYTANLNTGAYGVVALTVQQDVRTYGNAEFKAETYTLSEPSLGFSSNPYTGLEGSVSQLMRGFIRDWNEVH